MAQQNINPNSPPIVWSTVDEAFQRINANFAELYLSIGGDGVDLTSLASSIVPDNNALRNLGSEQKQWNQIWAVELNLGAAQITATSGGDSTLSAVNLPQGSTVGGALIRNPDESSFKTVRVSGQADVVADNFEGVVNFVGNSISIVTNAATDTVSFNNTGVTGAVAGTGVAVSSATGNVTITNTGVVNAVAGAGIGVSAATGTVTFNNTGVRQLVAGSGIVLDAATGIVTVSNSAPNVAQNVYRFIAVAGQATLDPAGPLSTLNIAVSGSGLSITLNPGNNLITFANTGVTSIGVDDAFTVSSGTGSVNVSLNSTLQRNIVGDITGSVFADSSAMMIDSVSGTVLGAVQNHVDDIKIFGGNTGEVLSTDGAGNLIFVAFPDLPDIGNITFVGNVIDSADSSAIVVQPSVEFNSDVTVENDLIVRNLLTVQGTIAGYTNTETLKQIVADSADFADFQTRIAAL